MLTYLKAWIFSQLPKSEKGQDLAEYALLLSLIAIVVIAAILVVGPLISGVFSTIADCLPDGAC